MSRMLKRPQKAAALLIAVWGVMVPHAGRAADATAGQAVFARCRICHSLVADAPSGVGPNLHDLFGRKAGTGPNFDYSDAMRGSGVVWNDDTLSAYLRDPRAFMPGNRMAFPGIKEETDLADLLAYLHQASK